MPRYWITYLGGKGKVEDLAGFAPSDYGTNLRKASSQNATAEDFNLPAENNPDGEDNPSGTTCATPASSSRGPTPGS